MKDWRRVMVPILVLISFIIIASIRWYIMTERNKAAKAARAYGPIPVPQEGPTKIPATGFFYHPGHTWVYVHDDQMVSVGTTDFASHFAGNLAKVKLPKEGMRMHKGDPAWTLISRKRRRLDQTMPIDGKVVAVNSKLIEDPNLAQSSPFEHGWVLRVRPRHLMSNVQNLFSAESAQKWTSSILSRITAQLSPALGIVAQDGGEWSSAFGDRMTEEAWESIRDDLFGSKEAESLTS